MEIKSLKDKTQISILQLEDTYSSLLHAYLFGSRERMIKAYIKAEQLGIPHFSDKIRNETIRVFHLNDIDPQLSKPIVLLTPLELKLNVEGCLNALLEELNQRKVYTSAQNILYQPHHSFNDEEILYRNKDGNQLKVSDLLSLSKYALSIAEAVAPDNVEYSKAKTIITAMQGISTILTNKPQDKPINKNLHLTASFLASNVKSELKDSQDQRTLAISETIVDLAIDFFCKI